MRNMRTALSTISGLTADLSELKADLVNPEAFQTPKARAYGFEIRRTDVADRLQRDQVPVEQAA